MRGILIVNKPAGIVSYDVIRRLRRVLPEVRFGHAGTLDPMASGVLLVLVNEATKVSRLLMGLPKEYEAEVRFGIATDTDDITGRVVAESAVPVLSAEELSRVLSERFSGVIEQVPPGYSALRFGGVRSYRLARQGVVVRHKPRRVMVYSIGLEFWETPVARIRVRVSSGTYIRSLAREIGQVLGVCATLSGLVRTMVGDFSLSQAQDLSGLLDSPAQVPGLLVPIEEALGFLPKMVVSEADAASLRQGKVVGGVLSGVEAGGVVLVYTEDRRFMGLVRWQNGLLKPERIIYAE